MMETARLDLPELLPPESVGCEQCLERFESELRSTRGVAGVHLNRTRGVAILHFDPAVISTATVQETARREGARLGESYVHRVLPIEGMDCADCALTLERGVGRLDGVRAVAVNFAGARMAVEYASNETNLDAIGKRVQQLGYRVGAQPGEASDQGAARWGVLAERSTQMTALGAALTIAGLAVSLLTSSATVATLLYAAAAAIAGVPIARKGLAGLRATHQLDINVLMTVAVIGAALLGDWLEAATVVVLFAIGETLEGFTMDRTRRSLRSLLALAPIEAIVRGPGGEQLVPIAAIMPGDLVVVRPGERVAADGVVVSGRSTVDQAPITGESVPVERGPGEEIFAGSVNGQGVLTVRANRPASDSTLARIIHMVEDAQAQKAPTQRFVDSFARYYTPAVVAAAALVALLPPLAFDGNWQTWFYRALVLLVIACPCALVISTPVAIVAALSAAARNGVLIKGGAYLESAGTLRALAFDKTGTLTRGEPAVASIVPLGAASADDVLRLAAAVERHSEHPLGAAIVREAVSRGLSQVDSHAEQTTAYTGLGIEAVVDGALVRAGSKAFVTNGAASGELDEHLGRLQRAGETPVVVSRAGVVAGIIGLADELRPEAPGAVRAVRLAGIDHTVMLTGDRREIAESIAARTGIEEVEPELLPGDKVGAIERLLARHGRVGMIGDGVNDAPALARATVGIAMGAAGSHAALETADIALMSDDLSRLGYTLRLSRRARQVIMQNIVVALGIKLVFLSLAVTGEATLWQAVFADVGASLIVIANAMRLLRASAG